MFIDKKKPTLIVFISTALYSSSLFAQNLPNSESSMNNNVVIGTTVVRGSNAIDGEEDSRKEIIDRAELDSSSHQHAAEMLQDAPSVYTPISYSDPTVSVNMRGVQDFGRVNTNIDGMRQNFQRSGYQDRNGSLIVDPELLSSIHIKKGVSSGSGGLGTIGGQVNFRTVDFDDVIKKNNNGGMIVRGETGVGKWANGNKYKSSFTAGYKLTDNVSVMAAVSDTKTGDYRMGSEGESIIRPGRVQSGHRILEKFAVPDHLLNTYKTGYSMSSYLGKIRWNFSENQSLKLSYMKTKSEFNVVDYDDSRSDETLHHWRFKANDKIQNENINLGYTFQSDNPLLNLSAKVYRANTQLHEYFPESSNIPKSSQDLCITNPGKYYFMTGKRCSAQTSIYETNTYGITLNNQSFINFRDTILSADYGVEWVSDRTIPREINGPNGAASGIASTPKGSRELASTYLDTRLDYLEWLSLFAGVRFDSYKLKGDARVKTKFSNMDTGIDETYSVTNTGYATSPTIGISIRPFDFMEISSNYGKGWRPPSLTETLLSGGTPASGLSATVLIPSPVLKPETSTNLDLGVTFNFEQLFTQDDELTLALSHYRTKVDNYMIMHLGVITPDANATDTLAFVNRTDPVIIEGSELTINYDTGFAYGGMSASIIDVDEGNQCYNPNVLLTLKDPVNKKACGNTFYSPFPNQNKLTAYLGMRLLNQRLDTRITMRNISDKEDSVNTAAKPNRILNGNSGIGYTRWDLTLKYMATEELTINLYGRNLTDQQYSNSLGAYRGVIQAPGRSVAIGARYQF
ncbi:TonB dependent receptor protein [Moritella viscosa]|uniref:TonB-dependent receptor domain-containing protein n=1 Tax=Moritella viscosa TaxID=80854 RepID=UPI0005D436E4|nr:TonB-dependent receptor [Moritella viscosa]SHO01350.1 TonB dependent receptor protein [Moritella viscosa]SHO20476.1 TonB dependent receptor protein [Moritella viscosa]